MNCRKVQSLISAYVDCELPGVDMLTIRHHLGSCKECQMDFEEILRLKRAFGTLTPVRPSTDFAVQICRHLDEVTVPKHVQLLGAVKRHFTFPERRAFASVTVGVIAVLLMFRSGAVNMTSPSMMTPVATVSSASYDNQLAGFHVDPVRAVSGTIKPMKASFFGLGFVDKVESASAASGNTTMVNFLMPAR